MEQAPPKHRPIEAEADGLILFRRAVAPDLAPWVVQITGYRENGAGLSGSVEMAPLVVPLSFGEEFQIGLGRTPHPDEIWGSFTSGLYPGPVVINSSGRSRCIQVDFTPPGALRFFGFPAAEIAARIVALDEIADKGIDALRDRLAGIRDWESRLSLAEAFIRRRLADAPEISFAWNALLRSGGGIRIAALSERIGWSRKHLRTRFTDEFGISPKTAARMARFNHALALAADGTLPLAQIAAEAGYADQAHFSREFREFGGTTPAGWRAAR
ncbi:Helix-turn-helix domain-containing protein [Paracoccus aminovorans]|uniref:Helix-turn-helix domain-containing protein n=1 Tax=Paracoccus aminovorans TaxID=34004 RepID=A0A1I3DUF5_9RHOB|nr:helix-turn-helix transcriptional regulator [Paracoccus aminovorans]CQR86927.1 AraC family transcriptional regulator [Paracoccus aminovorans]SFH90273.1 Helix-turn-helix domain-containing protein [Paracoccus aminovorans]